MFTGIITDIGRVARLEGEGDLRCSIACGYDLAGVEIGASIACDGVCLTVVDTSGDAFVVDISAETLSCTNLGNWREGAKINLERPLKVGEELGGHIVTGHVDGVGRIVAISDDGASKRVEIAAPKGLGRYIAAKGSIAVNGVSLTVNQVIDQDGATNFTVNIIPHSQKMTNLGDARPGDAVNLEIDVLARYVARLEKKD